MLMTNHNHIAAPIEAPDDSVIVAAEAEFLGECINDAMKALNELKEAQRASENEWNRTAREYIRRAKFHLECALEPQEED